MHWLLVLLLISSLAPDLATAAEGVAHVTIGASASETDPGSNDDRGTPHDCEDGCSCLCCQPVVPSKDGVTLGGRMQATGGFAPVGALVASVEPSRPFRPPIR